MPELPGNFSDTIVLGTVINMQPYLTSNHKGVFTEITVNVERIFDHVGTTAVRQTLLIAAYGGFLRLANGWVADTDVRGKGVPLSLGGRYVLFLTYTPNTACFRIVKGWELKNGKAAAMSEQDIGRTGTNTFNGKSEADFISAVQQVRATPQN